MNDEEFDEKQFPVYISKLQHKIRDEFNQVFEKYNFKAIYIPFICAIRDNPNGLTLVELQHILEFNKSHIARTVKELEERELLTRVYDKGYKFKYHLVLTEKCKGIQVYLDKNKNIVRKSFLSKLNDEDLKNLKIILTKLMSD
ncbi:MAG: hypothetical protein LBV51_03020 [Acholeplasmatales bacterium]|jgi:DNA-binding MarR family transcriptional regulator|nr:hypothetical protein [Acholeplasmatales bacterium]